MLHRRGIACIAAAVALLPAVPAAADAGPSLAVDAASGRHPISPLIYGWNSAPSPLASEIDVPVDRRGGNSADTLNWQTGFQNTGSDWFFENVPWCWAGAYDYCSGQTRLADAARAYTDRIDYDRAIGAKTLIDVPMLGHVPSAASAWSQPLSCSFPKGTFATQDRFDSYTDTGDPSKICGNGQNGGAGHWVTSSAQTADAQSADAAFQADWVKDLEGRYGTAANGGVAFYELGNEPALWNHTHHDWHPAPVDYDELWSKSRALASAIKQEDPSAAVLGFSEWGWTNYFCSAADYTADGCQSTDTDRAAHGGKELAAWLLQKFKGEADANGGRRLLDYLDLHYYRQDDGSPGIQATRSLWDAAYTDHSWIDNQIALLPRMHGWVQDNYPGTKISLSEYDLSTGNTDGDVLTQADTLGIFGRERLDLATLWPLQSQSHYADAFRLFRNYDGNHSKFGDTFVSSDSADESQLAVYAAVRSADGTLTIVVINKTAGELTSDVSLGGFAPGGPAQAWRWTGTATGIGRVADQQIGQTGFSATFPARSMTVFAIPPAEPPPEQGPSSAPEQAPQPGSLAPEQSAPIPEAAPPAAPPPPAPQQALVRCTVPQLTGLTLRAAKLRLERAHCRIGRIKKARSRRAKGRVVKQGLKRGAVRKSGSPVTLVVSRGR